MTDPIQIAAVKIEIIYGMISPGLYPVRIIFFVAVAKALRKNLIPDRLPHPLRRHVDIHRIHPRKRKALSQLSVFHILRRMKAILKIKDPFCSCLQLEEIPAPFIGRLHGNFPPEVLGQTHFCHDLLPAAFPSLVSAQNTGRKRVAIMNPNLFHFFSGLQPYH